MKKLEIKKLAEILDAKVEGEGNGSFSGVSIDSRSIKTGECFFAIKGEYHDGHDFVNEALSKGAACAVVSKKFKGVAQGTLLRVKDTIAALGEFGRFCRRQINCNVVAITGSAGKTTTRQIAFHVLSKHFKCHQAVKSFNNNIGLPLTFLGMEEDTEIAIVELGTNSKGEIIYLTKIAEPDVAVITNAYEAHIGNFGSVQAIIQEKSAIAEGLRKGGLLIINADSPGLEEWCRNEKYNLTTFGKTSHSDIVISNVELSEFGSSFTIDGVKIDLALAGRGNVENAAAAYAICKQFNITAKEFSRDIMGLVGVPMRLEEITIGTITVISDCYNANPASMQNALEVLANIAQVRGGRKVFICGPMLELGAHSQRLHTELGEAAAKANVGLLLTVGQFGKIVCNAAIKTSRQPLETHCFENTKILCDKMAEFIKTDDIILVKGSRVAGLEAVVEKLKGLFAAS